jgi:hypothetical protein
VQLFLLFKEGRNISCTPKPKPSPTPAYKHSFPFLYPLSYSPTNPLSKKTKIENIPAQAFRLAFAFLEVEQQTD